MIERVVSSAVVADSTASEVLHSLGVQNFDCVVNCIGNDIQASILTTLICKDLGIKYIVERIGADMVIFPEVFMGKRVANILTNPSINEVMNITDDFKIVEMTVLDSWTDKTIADLDIRKKHKISIIFIKRGEEVIHPEPETVLQKGDILIVAGEHSKLETLSNKSSEVIDVAKTLQESIDE